MAIEHRALLPDGEANGRHAPRRRRRRHGGGAAGARRLEGEQADGHLLSDASLLERGRAADGFKLRCLLREVVDGERHGAAAQWSCVRLRSCSSKRRDAVAQARSGARFYSRLHVTQERDVVGDGERR